ncbi:MAG: hypothetical protein AB1640_11860 [bacterium]
MLNAAVSPPRIMPSLMGPALPSRRAAELPGIASLEVRELFPDIPEKIYLHGEDLSRIRTATERALDNVDMGMIRPGDSVNLLCSEHGFSILEGHAYAEMLKTIKEVVQNRTGCENIRLRFCVGGALIEAREMIPHFGLAEAFGGRVAGVGPFDRGIPIETEIGTLYGLAKVYDADWIIHAHYDDPRETYFHRLVGRSLKAFTMSYARLETRSVYHMNFGSRSSNVVPRAIFESPFVQKKFAFTCFQVTSPAGIIGIDADNDHHRLDRRLTVNTLRSYGKLLRLFAEIDACIAVLDAGRWPWYLHAGGLTSGNLLKGPTDYLDLEIGSPRKKYPLTLNTAVKALVVNHSWRELFVDLASWYPTIVAGPEVARGLPQRVVKRAFIAEDLEKAMAHACELAHTDKMILFDGSYGAINLTSALGEYLLEKAPGVSRKVDAELLPMWLKQRGIDPQEA